MSIVSNDKFNYAMKFLSIDGSLSTKPPVGPTFIKYYPNQHVNLTAVKIIHKASLEGTDLQKAKLANKRNRIIKLNIKISNGDYPELTGMQIALPQRKLERMIEIATAIPRIVISTLITIALLPLAAVLLIAVAIKPNICNFDPKKPKEGVIPILLLHGTGFNESEWLVGRSFLKKSKYGSVFSMNYEKANEAGTGIDDYAKNAISKKIREIIKKTKTKEIILIGHSMGGMVAGEYAERCAKNDGVTVRHVISIASPWRGSPILDFPGLNLKAETKKRQMSCKSPFRKALVKAALTSERAGKRKYYSIYDTVDFAAPNLRGRLTEDPRRQREFSYLSHYGIIASPRAWLQVRSWLDDIYSQNNKSLYSRLGIAK